MAFEADRRKLRQVYSQYKSRVRAVADARDAPRRDDRFRRDDGRRDNSQRNNNNNNSQRNNDRRNNDRQGAAPRRIIVTERVTRQHGFGQGGRQVVLSRNRREQERGSGRRFADSNVAKSGARARFNRSADSRNSNNNNNNNNNASKRNGGNKNGGGNQPRFKKTQGKQVKVQIRKQQQKTKNAQGGDKKKEEKKVDKKPALSLTQLDAQLASYKS